MKTITFCLITGFIALSLASCQQKDQSEIGGQACLAEARAALQANNFQGAKRSIEKMRKDFPTALNAREEGILLLDSINLAEAKVQLQGWIDKLKEPDISRISFDTLDFNRDEAQQKVRFFEKKIAHDKSKMKRH